jgi:hypothetical protein
MPTELEKRFPPEYFDDYLPPWEEVKKRYSAKFLAEREEFIAEKQKIVERAKRRSS